MNAFLNATASWVGTLLRAGLIQKHFETTLPDYTR
jgi:hypothetical protein